MRFVYDGLRMNPVVDAAVESMASHIKDAIIATAVATFDALQTLSYTIALLGGGVCIIVYAITGVRRAKKAFGVLVLAHALIRWLL